MLRKKSIHPAPPDRFSHDCHVKAVDWAMLKIWKAKGENILADTKGIWTIMNYYGLILTYIIFIFPEFYPALKEPTTITHYWLDVFF